MTGTRGGSADEQGCEITGRVGTECSEEHAAETAGHLSASPSRDGSVPWPQFSFVLMSLDEPLICQWRGPEATIRALPRSLPYRS